MPVIKQKWPINQTSQIPPFFVWYSNGHDSFFYGSVGCWLSCLSNGMSMNMLLCALLIVAMIDLGGNNININTPDQHVLVLKHSIQQIVHCISEYLISCKSGYGLSFTMLLSIHRSSHVDWECCALRPPDPSPVLSKRSQPLTIHNTRHHSIHSKLDQHIECCCSLLMDMLVATIV